ncbi:MAG TPA: acyltransferase [Trinickia sp.]|uniref:acyltransferase n=1 Tax=Trinickia sp. TaxID=2571163 RepID=UPI002BEB3A12|nr:acyltransferase [Trinickia sp.]HVW52744.1 acyltransferase [Trinickia sp.]
MNPGYWTADELEAFGARSVGSNVRVAKNCTLIGIENMSFGENVRVDGPTVLSASVDGYIRIASYVHIGGMCFLAGAGGIEMCDFSGLSQGVRIYSASDDYSGEALTNPTVPKRYLNVRTAPVRIGRHVIVGSGAVILPGCDIGEGASIGAMSLVKKNLAPWGIYGGTPVRFIKKRSQRLLALEAELMMREDEDLA